MFILKIPYTPVQNKCVCERMHYTTMFCVPAQLVQMLILNSNFKSLSLYDSMVNFMQRTNIAVGFT